MQILPRTFRKFLEKYHLKQRYPRSSETPSRTAYTEHVSYTKTNGRFHIWRGLRNEFMHGVAQEIVALKHAVFPMGSRNHTTHQGELLPWIRVSFVRGNLQRDIEHGCSTSHQAHATRQEGVK